MMNGGPTNRGYGMQMNLAQKYQNQQIHHQQQQQQQHQQQQQQTGHHPHHHHGHQQENGGHGQSTIGHQHTFSAGTLNATPHFTPSHLQNGSGNSQSGLGKYSEHWQQQLQLVQEARQAHSPHYYARANAHDNKGIGGGASQTKESDREDRNRVSHPLSEVRRQDWMSLDFGGQGCRALSAALFNYTFLDKLYLNYNKLTHIPAAIGQLRSLSHLDLSNNQISEMPPETGMLVNLKNLLLFDNNLHTLPYEMGSLFLLDMLGVEGNPLEEGLKSEIMQSGTRALITHLRENAPGTSVRNPSMIPKTDSTDVAK